MDRSEPKDAKRWGEGIISEKEEKFVIRALPATPIHYQISGACVNGTAYYKNGVNLSLAPENVMKEEFGEAGYEHLEAAKNKSGSATTATLANVDIQEHRLPSTKLNTTFQTSINTKDPAQSFGLSSEEAGIRLRRYGRNILTPPKKKSGFRKVQTIFSGQYSP